jgi:nucleoside-diphosphate-sugar epimerase
MPRILITGATGFVGSALCLLLEQKKYTFTKVVRTLTPDLKEGSVAVVPQIDSTVAWEKILKNYTVVIHLAALTHAVQNGKYASVPYEMFKSVNIDGTKHLAESAAKAGVNRFIYLSSIKVNGESTQPDHPFTENDPANPQDFYGESKYKAEQELKKVCKTSSMDYVILRPPLIYGAGVKGNFLSLLKICDTSHPLPFANIDNRRSFIYLENLTDIIERSISSSAVKNQIFLVKDITLSTPALIKEIRQHLNRPSRLFPCPSSLLRFLLTLAGRREIFDRLSSSLEVLDDKIKKRLPWSPRFSLEEGLKKTLTWYCQNRKN